MAEIKTIPFNENTPEEMRSIKYGENWPVVYVINNDEEAYIGETVNASVRSGQHLKNEDRQRLSNISIISDEDYNKSVILDLEAFLIKHMAADEKYILQNGNMGMALHDYYEKDRYESSFSSIWDNLRKRELVNKSLRDIENSDLFKYSPYKELNRDQYQAIDSFVQNWINSLKENKEMTTLVEGGAGTGKTVMAIYLIKLISEAIDGTITYEEDMDPGLKCLYDNLELLPKNLKMAFVVPMQSLRSTIKKVFKSVKGLNPNMVISPLEVPKDTYDLLIVDEAHRLRQRRALSQYPPFDKNNRLLGLGDEGTELDWILKCSKHQILFYDSMQSVKPSDVDKEAFKKLLDLPNIYTYELESQLRCKGGNGYIDYVKAVLSDDPPKQRKEFDKYDLRIFDDVNDMILEIKQRDKTDGLSRTVAGYSWKWKSKKDGTLKDIFIENHSYQWNSANKDWVNSPNSINEIGCIHTIQGYDLNYAGVIFGNEIKYDEVTKEFVVDKSNYHDLPGKTSLRTEEELKEFILNIYRTMMTRGIKGTYVYVCDSGLKKYLKKFF